jgi:hypothetical protein
MIAGEPFQSSSCPPQQFPQKHRGFATVFAAQTFAKKIKKLTCISAAFSASNFVQNLRAISTETECKTAGKVLVSS